MSDPIKCFTNIDLTSNPSSRASQKTLYKKVSLFTGVSPGIKPD